MQRKSVKIHVGMYVISLKFRREVIGFIAWQQCRRLRAAPPQYQIEEIKISDEESELYE